MPTPLRRKIRSSFLGIAATTAIALLGCGLGAPKPVPTASPPHPTNAPSGHIAWPGWAKDNPLPGVDHAAAYACWDARVVFVVWTNFDTAGGGTSGPTMDGVYRASLTAESGTQVECECQTNNGISGKLSVRVDKTRTSEVPYNLEKGRAFFVSTHRGVPEVIQLKRDLSRHRYKGPQTNM